MRSMRSAAFACGLAGALTLVPALGADYGQWRSPTQAPDVFGGWASTHVIVRVVPGVRPDMLDDGRLTFVQSGSPRSGDTAQIETRLAEVLATRAATEIHPTGSVTPQNTELASSLGLDRYYTIEVPRGTDTPAFVRELAEFGSHIEIAELDGVGGILQNFPNDSSFGLQYGLHNTGQNINGQVGTADADLDAPEAWDLHTGTSAITLAMIDTGVSESHPDLAGKLVPGRNIVDNNNDTDDSIWISHGTHCAGIAAANSNNGIGVAGVSWGALIMPIKVVDDLGSGVESQCADGIIWAADHGTQVGSMSLGYDEGTTYLHNAVIYGHQQGMVLVVATGNTPGHTIFYPARWPETIAVGATDNRDNLASFTTTGPEMSVGAPGVSVYSCVDSFLMGGFDTYAYSDGTSMACPHVSGLACLVRSANPALTNDEVRDIIESTADDLGTPGWDPSFGYGRINAFAAVSAAIQPSVDGDVDGDGDVDLADLSSLLAAYNSCVGDPNYNPDADFSGDGCVDLVDLSVLLANYGFGT